MRDHALPELIQSVDRGDIPVSVAAGLAAAPEAIQRRAVLDPKRAMSSSSRRRGRQREVELGAKQLACTGGDYGVFLIGPAMAVRRLLSADYRTGHR